MSQNIHTASREWATRPEDQRYLSLADLHKAVLDRKHECWTVAPYCKDLRAVPLGSDGIALQVFDPTQGEDRQLYPSNWSFSQLAQYAGAPGSYLRKLPAELAAINLQWGLEHNSPREEALILAQSNGQNYLRSMTGVGYGRIWDHEVVEAVQKVNQDGRWQIPSASYTTNHPKRATTLYASDRDVFIFLVDPKNPIEHQGEQLFRGFYTWNSEVGSAVFGICSFLYRYVCDNRIIWGATSVQELRIRHTRGAPERFAHEGAKYLLKYANESTAQVIAGIDRAKRTEIPLNEGKDETVEGWLQKRGLTKAQAKASVETAKAEEGQARTFWDIVNGITAYARSIPNSNDRVELETKAGHLMEMVAE